MTSELGANQGIRRCAGCGIEGMKASTPSGEIVEGGAVVDLVPEGITPLLVGKADGSEPEDWPADE